MNILFYQNEKKREHTYYDYAAIESEQHMIAYNVQRIICEQMSKCEKNANQIYINVTLFSLCAASEMRILAVVMVVSAFF